MAERPLSPHLSVYKFKYTLTTSIVNRLSGLVLSLGFVLLTYWLVTIAGGARAYAQARALLGLGIFKLVYAVLIAAFVYHLIAGLRHLVWDTGRGIDRVSARRSAWWVAVLSLLVTVLLAYGLLRPGAYAP
jgi:succinate dehydrogenase / fumarate reductase, cytochrome b subunit